MLGYGTLVLSSLIYFVYGDDGVGDGIVCIWTRRIVVAGGVVLGCGASTLWTAQGRLILQYASRAEACLLAAAAAETANTTTMSNADMPRNKSQTGELMGLFWAIFQCSSLVGGFISFFYYGRKQPHGSTALYSVFLGFIVVGALSTQLLLPPEMLQRRCSSNTSDFQDIKEADLEMTNNERSPLTTTASELNTGKRKDRGIRIGEELSNLTWREETSGTIQLLFTHEMMCLSPLFFYTGFNQPYQQATFGNRFFTRRTIGAELIVFHMMEIVGAIVVGRFLDRDIDSMSTRRTRAKICLGTFFAINLTGNVFAAMQECEAKKNDGIAIAHDISDMSVVPPTLAFACWGFADAQIQVFIYWLMGGMYSSGSDHSRAVGWYKCVQSLGTSIGFYLIPISRLSEMSQLTTSSIIFVLGTALSVAFSANIN